MLCLQDDLTCGEVRASRRGLQAAGARQTLQGRASLQEGQVGQWGRETSILGSAVYQSCKSARAV